MVVVIVPKLNENDDIVEVAKLLVEDGCQVSSGQLLFVTETSKATVDIEAEASGTVRWLVGQGYRARILEPIGYILGSGEEMPAHPPGKPPTLPDPSAGGAAIATTKARTLAEKLGVDLSLIQTAGIIQASDVEQYALNRKKAIPVAPVLGDRSAGRLNDEFVRELAQGHEEFANLPSDFKCWLYRQNGAQIGKNVKLGKGTVIQAQSIVIGDDAEIESNTTIKCRHFQIGELGVIGSNTRIFCRDLIAGDVVLIRFNVAIAGSHGGTHDCIIGDGTFIAYDVYVNTDRDVRLGRRVCIAPECRIYTHRHWLESVEGYPYGYAPVTIGDRSWIGPGANVLPGVNIGREVTVMANSVVSINPPDGALVGGVPATILKKNQKVQSDPAYRKRVVIEILESAPAIVKKYGWSLSMDDPENVWWRGVMTKGAEECVVVAGGGNEIFDSRDARRQVLLIDSGADITEPRVTTFDLAAKRVAGRRDEASDLLRSVLDEYGIRVDPFLWRFGARCWEDSYDKTNT